MLGSIPKTKNKFKLYSRGYVELGTLTDTLTERPQALNNTHSTKEIGGGIKGSRWSVLSRAMSTQHYSPPLHTGFMLKACEHYLMALQWPVLYYCELEVSSA